MTKLQIANLIEQGSKNKLLLKQLKDEGLKIVLQAIIEAKKQKEIIKTLTK